MNPRALDIRRKRKQYRITQAQLSLAIRRAEEWLGRVETGLQLVAPDEIEEIHAVLDELIAQRSGKETATT